MPRIVAVLVLASLSAVVVRADERPASRLLTFERDVRPILKANCFGCHGEGDELKGELDLRLVRRMREGGESGPAIEVGDVEESLLYERVVEREMPPGKKKLTAAETTIIARWIKQGAITARPEPEEIGLFTQDERSFWAFQPIARPGIPDVDSPRIKTPVDAFVLSRLQQQGLEFSAEADKRTLIRRASFDLLGLPPSPEEFDAFVSDASPDAYEKLIDRLLESPHYGERWGRHWLDVAGYADSEGYTNNDPVRTYAYKYRDYVIRSLNADKPFDTFIQEQLAGDEMVRLPHKNLSASQIEKLVATGFLRMAEDGTGTGGVDQALARNQVLADTIKIVSTSLLGLSVGCAQCHNHRYDPIPQVDYYRMRAIFEPVYDVKNWRALRGRLISLYTDDDRKKAAEVEAEARKIDVTRQKKQQKYIERTFQKELAKLPSEIRERASTARNTPAAKRTKQQQDLLKEYPSLNVSGGSLYLYDRSAADDLKKMAAEAGKVRSKKPVEDFVRATTEVAGQLPVTYLFFRGDHNQPRQPLAPAGLSIVDSLNTHKVPIDDASLPTTGRRLAYARRLTDGTHPLTARVLVNRFWMQHFGRGLVGSPSDFGKLGEQPTHPELLDWLANDFMAGGWKLKRLHRLIMTSTAYRQSSQRTPALDQADPDNKLLGRMPVRRLEAEAIRDAVLTVSGKLNPKQFGPPVPVMEDEVGQFIIGVDNKNGENRNGAVISLNGEEFRRSIYVQVRRSRPLAVLETFDSPTMEPNCEIRTASTVAPQSLMLMNSQFAITYAKHFADRVRKQAGDDSRAQVARAWMLAFADAPDEEEITAANAFLSAQAEVFAQSAAAADSSKKDKAKEQADPRQQALATFCQALFSANRFLYVD